MADDPAESRDVTSIRSPGVFGHSAGRLRGLETTFQLAVDAPQADVGWRSE
jgi:hypothetical protein